MIFRIAALAALLCLLAPSAQAADGDTTIQVETVTYAERIRPSVSSGNVTYKYKIVLQSGGKVGEQINSSGSAPFKSANVRSLGGSDSNVTYRVKDDSTIERIVNNPTHQTVTTIRASGKSCTASVVHTLKPGQTEYQSYSVNLGTQAFYKTLRPVSASCTIE